MVDIFSSPDSFDIMDLQSAVVRRPFSAGARILILALFFCSGISGLCYEVVWTRQLTVILGNTVYAVSTVLAAFMGGLALGSFLAGRFIDRRDDPLRVYAVLEILIGVVGFCLSSVLAQTGPAYLWLHRTLSEYPLILSVVRYIFTFGLLVMPTTLMGATLPVLSRFVVASRRDVGLDIGRLYALNTLGAALGCYAAGFLLIGNLGIGATVRVASALSIAVGISAWLCRRRLDGMSHQSQKPDAPARDGEQSTLAGASGLCQHNVTVSQSGEKCGPGDVPSTDHVQPDHEGESTPAWSQLRLLVLGAFGVSGLVALGYEVVWTRLLTPYLGNSVYAFCTMLTAFLVGIAFGSLAFSRVASRSTRGVAILGIIQAAIALYVLFSILVYGWTAERLQAWMQPEPWWQGTGVRFLGAFALMFLPTFLMGAAFPVAGQVYVGHLRRLGQRLGELYACNTVGAILGAAIAGFVLLPLCGVQQSLLVLLCLNLGVGLVLCAAEPRMRYRGKATLLTALALAATAGLFAMPGDVFRRIQEIQAAGGKLVCYKEDVLGTVTVTQRDAERTLATDNLPVAGTGDVCLSSHKPLGHLPMLLHPNPKTAYVLGFGGGGTTYAIATHPGVRRIDATELSQSIVDVAPMFRQINHNVISDPRVHLKVTDGRHYLLTTRRSYDVISVDLLWPQTAGAGSLYTLEFYQLCHRRLGDDGIMVQWVHPGSIPKYYLKTILRTIGCVFPHTSLWWAQGRDHIFMVASKSPLLVDTQRMTQRMNHPDVHRDLAEIALDEPAMLLGYFIAHDNALAEFAAGSDVLNTDDLPLLEYKLPLHKGRAAWENLEAMTELQRSVLSLVNNVSSEQEKRIAACQRSNYLTCKGLIALKQRRPDVAVENWRQAI